MPEIIDRKDIKHPYPALANICSRECAEAIKLLYHYVRPEGDYVLCRGDLNQLDGAFDQIEKFIQSNERWDGHTWTKR